MLTKRMILQNFRSGNPAGYLPSHLISIIVRLTIVSRRNVVWPSKFRPFHLDDPTRCSKLRFNFKSRFPGFEFGPKGHPTSHSPQTRFSMKGS